MKSQSGETIGPGYWLIRSDRCEGQGEELHIVTVVHEMALVYYYSGYEVDRDVKTAYEYGAFIRKLDLEKLANEKT